MATSKNLLLAAEFLRSISFFVKSRFTAFITGSFLLLALLLIVSFIAGTPPHSDFTLPHQIVTLSPRFLSTDSTDGRLVAPGHKDKRIINQVGTASVSLLNNLSSVTFAGRSKNSSERMVKEGYQDLKSCNIFDGNWVADYSKPIYPPGSCPFLDDAFNCAKNGRPDSNFMKLRWQPKGCNIPRLDGNRMLKLLRGKRLVFVGDSLNRNMWESLVCILRQSLKDKKRVSEVSGRHEFKTEGFYAFRFADYNCSIEFARSPFLVQEWEVPVSTTTGARKETLRLDVMEKSASKYRDADIVVFNTGHWWTHEKTSRGKDYYQEGNHVYAELHVEEAYRKALTTWAKWVDSSVDTKRTKVFFRGYSSSHFRGGQWKSGGSCSGETEPIRNESHLAPYPKMIKILESVMGEMTTPVVYLNITKMTAYRKDGHPSVFREPTSKAARNRIQDCSHWCLPGIPDVWNQLLYYHLLLTSVNEKATDI